jgi:hypothetical protein
MKKRISIMLCAVGLLSFGSRASAVEIVNFAFPGNNFTNGNYWTLGYEFTVNAPITINGLSVFDSGMDGFVDGFHYVGLWDSSSNLIATTTVTSSDPLDGWFRVGAIGPMTLGTGTYVVGATMGNDLYTWANIGTTVIPQVTFNTDRFIASGYQALALPTNTSGGVDGWFGGNVRVGGSVPDGGSTLFLISAGLLGLGALRRRSQRRA